MLSHGQMSTSGYSRSKITTFVFTSDLLKVGLYYLYISFWFSFFKKLWFKQRYHCGIIWYKVPCERLDKSITTEIADFLYCCLAFNSMFFFIGNQHVISFLQLILLCLMNTSSGTVHSEFPDFSHVVPLPSYYLTPSSPCTDILQRKSEHSF